MGLASLVSVVCMCFSLFIANAAGDGGSSGSGSGGSSAVNPLAWVTWVVEEVQNNIAEEGGAGISITWLAIVCLVCAVLLYLLMVTLLGSMDVEAADDLPAEAPFQLLAKHPSYPAPRGQLVPQCPCFLSDNYFLDKVGDREARVHVRFTGDEEAFCKEHASLLRKWSAEELHDALAQLRQERHLRETAAQRMEEHRRRVKAEYTCITRCRDLQLKHLRPELRSLMACIDETWTMDGRLPPTVNAEALVGAGRLLRLEDGIYAFPIFTSEYCSELYTELANFRATASGDLQQSINSMNRYGVSLHALGFTPAFSNVIMASIANPLVEALYGAEYATLDHHKCFTVEYGDGADRDLSLHFDNSLITFNICITEDFRGGELQFFGENTSKPRKKATTWRQRCGWAVVHRGNAWHRALPVTRGHRTNIVMWFRSQRHARDFGCDMCGQPVALSSSAE